jgi:hypothetical protein
MASSMAGVGRVTVSERKSIVIKKFGESKLEKRTIALVIYFPLYNFAEKTLWEKAIEKLAKEKSGEEATVDSGRGRKRRNNFFAALSFCFQLSFSTIKKSGGKK